MKLTKSKLKQLIKEELEGTSESAHMVRQLIRLYGLIKSGAGDGNVQEHLEILDYVIKNLSRMDRLGRSK